MNGLLGGNLKGDITVTVNFDPASLALLAILIVVAIVFSHGFVKIIG